MKLTAAGTGSQERNDKARQVTSRDDNKRPPTTVLCCAVPGSLPQAAPGTVLRRERDPARYDPPQVLRGDHVGATDEPPQHRPAG